MNPRAQAILDFWFVETPSEKRFKKDEKFDQLIREKFLNDYEKASLNEHDDWQDTAMGSLALVILFDQFSRNMFRDHKRAFEQDSKTRLIVHSTLQEISEFMIIGRSYHNQDRIFSSCFGKVDRFAEIN